MSKSEIITSIYMLLDMNQIEAAQILAEEFDIPNYEFDDIRTLHWWGWND